MQRSIATLALILAGCSSDALSIPAPSYRDASVTMGSIAAFEPARYAGTWYEVAAYPGPFRSECRETRTHYAPTDEGGFSVVDHCRGPDGALRRIEGRAMVAGPGRLAVEFPAETGRNAVHWVLWVDKGYRTAVVGVPSGQAAWVLNREPRIPADRLAAAREILAFNGYDLTRLRTTPQAP